MPGARSGWTGTAGGKRLPRQMALGLLLGLLLALAALELAAGQPPGRAVDSSALFFQNTGADGRPLPARIGPGGGVAVRSAQFNCAGCHGSDARGRSEGGVAAPAIDWHRLTKPWGHAFDDGRRRKPYDEALFHRALTMGLDASGNALDPAMPRFGISAEEAGALFRWLRDRNDGTAAGVSADAVFIGHPEEAGGSIMQALREAVGMANAGGGIHGRRIELVALGRAVPGKAVLALVCPTPLARETLRSVRAEVPSLGCERNPEQAAAPDPQAGGAAYTLFPGSAARQAILAAYAAQVLGVTADRIWMPGSPAPAQPPLAVIASGLEGPDPALLARWAADRTWRPWILLSEGERLAGETSRLREQWPQDNAGILAGFPLPPPKTPVKVAGAGTRLGTALAAVLLEGLRQSGREVNAVRLAASIGRLERVPAGDFPRIRFESGQPAGLHGMHVAQLLPGNQGWSGRSDWFEP